MSARFPQCMFHFLLQFYEKSSLDRESQFMAASKTLINIGICGNKITPTSYFVEKAVSAIPVGL